MEYDKTRRVFVYRKMYKLFSTEFSVLSHPSSTFTKHQTLLPRCKPVSLQSKRSFGCANVNRQGWVWLWVPRRVCEHTRYWQSFATWWQLLDEKRERESRTGLRAALWKREKQRAELTEGELDPSAPAQTHEAPRAQTPGSITPRAISARRGWHSPRCPASSLAPAPQSNCVPKPSSRVTIRQHSAFCNLMLLYPDLFSWKKTKACRFCDVNPQILGV